MRFQLAAIFGLGLILAGCGGAPSGTPLTESNRDEFSLGDVGEIYRVYTFSQKKPPTKLADFVPFEQMSPLGLRAIQSGSVVVRFGAVMNDVAEGPNSKDSADEVLAYAKDVPTAGGPVLMLNRTIKNMTAEEFKAAKLAGTGDSAGGGDKGKAAEH